MSRRRGPDGYIEPFARQFEVAKLDEAWQGAVIHVVDSAVPPDRPSGPRKLFIISGGTIAGFMIGVLWALSQAGLARLKTDPLTEGKFKGLGRALTF
jgi:tyrosine-protein kinase Etk/Wzc